MKVIELTTQYSQLLLKIAIETASHDMQKTLSMKPSPLRYLKLAGVLVKPWDTEMIVDNDGRCISRLS